MTRPRRGSIVFITTVCLATGIAFAAGSHLHARFPEKVLRRQNTQLAEAGSDGSNWERLVAAEPGGRRGRTRPVSDEESDLSPLDTFLQVFQLVKQNYVDKLPDDRKMAQGAIRAMLADLNDPNSRFLEPAEREALEATTKGRFAGIGAAISTVGQKRDGYTEHKMVVVTPIPGSPAAKAGLKAGDVITSVDSKWVLGADPFIAANRLLKKVQARDASEEELEKAVEAAQDRIKNGITLSNAQRLLNSGSGEKRTLVVQRTGAKDPITVEVTTAMTEVTPVTSKTLAGGVGYIRVAAFTETTGAAFKQALAKLPANAGLVLDLRGNPGGLLEPVKEIAGALTRGGTLMVEVGPKGTRKAVSLPVARTTTRPVVVLTDRGTASTSEVLAAALRDKKIGTLVGDRTFGDGLIQTLYPLPDGSAYTLTTGKLLSPTGGEWHSVGIAPGVALAPNLSDEQVLAKAVAILKSRSVAARAEG